MNRVDAEIPSDGYGIAMIVMFGLAAVVGLLINNSSFVTGGAF